MTRNTFTQEDLAWVWRSETLDPGRVMTVPLVSGASFGVDPEDPARVVSWELPPIAEPDAFIQPFGEHWTARLVQSLTADPHQGPPIPPQLSDEWARVAVVQGLRDLESPLLRADLLALDHALAWDAVGEHRRAAWLLASVTGLLDELLTLALRAELPPICEDDLQRACDLEMRLLASDGVQARVVNMGGVAFARREPRQDLEGTAQEPFWLQERLKAAMAQETSPRALRPTLAEVLAMHIGATERSDDADDGWGDVDASSVVPAGLQRIREMRLRGEGERVRDELLAALAVYREFGLPDRIALCEEELAKLDERWGSETADLADLEDLVSSWSFDLASLAPLVRDSDKAPTGGRVRIELDDERVFLRLMGRTRAEAEQWPTLTLTIADRALQARLILFGAPVQPLLEVVLNLSTALGTVAVGLSPLSEEPGMWGVTPLGEAALTSPGRVTLASVRHGV